MGEHYYRVVMPGRKEPTPRDKRYHVSIDVLYLKSDSTIELLPTIGFLRFSPPIVNEITKEEYESELQIQKGSEDIGILEKRIEERDRRFFGGS